ncbi:hypothetical protein SHO565_77660 [Streptomyces sp. HO565]
MALGADAALVLAAEAAGLFQDDDDAHDSAFREEALSSGLLARNEFRLSGATVMFRG